MEKKEIKSAPKAAPKKAYVAVVGFDTSDGQRFEAGDAVEGVKPVDLEALLEMGAIAPEAK